MSERLILASASKSRARILTGAGIPFAAEAADVDENAVKAALKTKGASVEDCAVALAEQKARVVAARHPAALVLGADQMLDCGGRWFDKPADRAAAAAHLRALSGRTHTLPTAIVAIADQKIVWRRVEHPKLTMRPLTEVFIADYLATAGDAVCSSVGAYQLEGLGAQLFERIEGDFFTILGLPLLPLLAFLRARGIVAA